MGGTVASDLLTCALCGLGFERADTLCSHGCPLGAMCRLVKCPGCGYEFPEEPEGGTWWELLLGRRTPEPDPRPEGVKALAELTGGQRARVVCVGARETGRHGSLAVFGFVPGAVITLIQRRPACVIKVDETELALDVEIAREVLVEPIEEGVPA